MRASRIHFESGQLRLGVRPMNMLIRKALASDVSVLIDLSRRTISASYRPFLGAEAVDGFLGSGAVDRYVQDNLCHCSVIVRDGQVVGYAVRRDNLIDLMMIDHDFHRQGLGTELLRRVEESLGPNHEPLKLESFEGNQAANAFYLKNSWLEVHRYFDKESGVNKIVFQKVTGRTRRCT
jgi:GNAT superfamily N-acetyltransferase